MSGGKKALREDVPWRASTKRVPNIHQSPVLKVSLDPASEYALAIMKYPDPIGQGFASEAKLEAAGSDCIVPGQVTPVRLLGLKVWPIDVNMKFLEPVQRDLRAMGKFMDSALNLMNASFLER